VYFRNKRMLCGRWHDAWVGSGGGGVVESLKWDRGSFLDKVPTGISAPCRRSEGEDGGVSYEVDLWKEGVAVGRGHLDSVHLTDHPGALEALQEAVQVNLPLPLREINLFRKQQGVLKHPVTWSAQGGVLKHPVTWSAVFLLLDPTSVYLGTRSKHFSSGIVHAPPM